MNSPSLIQNCPHQNNELPFFNNSQSTNLCETSYTINYFDQPPALGSDHSHASICCDEHPCTSCDLMFSHENSSSNLECAPVKEDICIETSFSRHLPIYPTIHNASTCVGDTPCSLSTSSNELSR